MDFIQHTLNWCRGDIFHGAFAATFGLVVITATVLFRVLGTTPYSKALLVPMIIVGSFYVVSGVGLAIVSESRIAQFQADYERDPAEFVTAEESRLDVFIERTRGTLYGLGGVILLGLALFYLWNTDMGRSIGLALLLLGFSAMFSDHFSEERARTYHQHIHDHLRMGNP